MCRKSNAKYSNIERHPHAGLGSVARYHELRSRNRRSQCSTNSAQNWLTSLSYPVSGQTFFDCNNSFSFRLSSMTVAGPDRSSRPVANHEMHSSGSGARMPADNLPVWTCGRNAATERPKEFPNSNISASMCARIVRRARKINWKTVVFVSERSAFDDRISRLAAS